MSSLFQEYIFYIFLHMYFLITCTFKSNSSRQIYNEWQHR